MEEGSRSFVICSVMLAVIACLGALSLLARADRVHFTRSPQFTAGCGNWQQKYVKLHRQITTGRQAKRFCVATTRSEKGLYDRLTGYITVFLVALVTDRAFLLHQPEDIHSRWEDIYEEKNVVWRAERHLDYDAEQTRDDFAHLDLWDEMLHVYGTGNETEPDPSHLLPKAELEALHPDAATLVLSLHNGYTARMLQNPHLGPKLRDMGLTPETAFGCAMEFLFPPKPEIYSHVAAEEAALRGNRSTLRIGLQIRMGDKMFTNKSKTPLPSEWERDMWAATIGFWDCADQIEKWAGRGYSNVLWYLASDSQDLRKVAKQKLGAKLVANTEAKLENSMFEGTSVSGLQLAAAEQSLLSRTDFQVVSMGSTFGRTAAMMSMKAPDSVYTIPPPYSQTRSCGRGEHDSLDSLAFVGLVRQKEDKTWHLGI